MGNQVLSLGSGPDELIPQLAERAADDGDRRGVAEIETPHRQRVIGVAHPVRPSVPHGEARAFLQRIHTGWPEDCIHLELGVAPTRLEGADLDPSSASISRGQHEAVTGPEEASLPQQRRDVITHDGPESVRAELLVAAELKAAVAKSSELAR
ncbi:hypothetical protein [Streptomyces sp. SID13031]|uniref:hypothetical protein n=1 Tax=Streptomyces sp. SID13031 TaxID=2706046 RepID=UPI0013CD7417|nr:hypothetical protein [Streptomyces sp. SID13031]NEA31225.1 hypothetical protein [Streptomyces sp. SID13031]